MADEIPVVTVDPKQELAAAIRRAVQQCGDLRVPLTLIAQQWFKSNIAIFQNKGPGQYEDYKPGPKGERPSPYEKFKIKHLGSQYPMLRLIGALEASLTDPSQTGAVQILNKTSLKVGTSVESKDGAPYPYFLHHGTKFMPARPVVLFGNEQVAPGAIQNRIEGWRQLLGNWAAAQFKPATGV